MPHGDALGVPLILLVFLVTVSKLSKVKGGGHEKLLMFSDGCAALTRLPCGRHSALWAVPGNGNLVASFRKKKVTTMRIDVSRAGLDLRRGKFT